MHACPEEVKKLALQARRRGEVAIAHAELLQQLLASAVADAGQRYEAAWHTLRISGSVRTSSENLLAPDARHCQAKKMTNTRATDFKKRNRAIRYCRKNAGKNCEKTHVFSVFYLKARPQQWLPLQRVHRCDRVRHVLYGWCKVFTTQSGALPCFRT